MSRRLALSALAMLVASVVAESCKPSGMKAATDAYVVAQKLGDVGALKPFLAEKHSYLDNGNTVGLDQGLISIPLPVDHNRSIHDPLLCTAFTEVVISRSQPFVIGTRMEFTNDTATKLTRIESVVMNQLDGLFNATNYLYWAKEENWQAIDPETPMWMPRKILTKQVDIFLERLSNPKKQVPYGSPCARREGGFYTGEGPKRLDNTCGQCLPSSFNVTNARYVVDEEFGAVSVFAGWPGLDRNHAQDARPVSFLFRIEGGWIRYIHRITSCVTAACGLTFTDLCSFAQAVNSQ